MSDELIHRVSPETAFSIDPHALELSALNNVTTIGLANGGRIEISNGDISIHSPVPVCVNGDVILTKGPVGNPTYDSYMKAYPELNLQVLTRTTDFSRSELFKDSVVYRPFAFPWAVEWWNRHEEVHWTKAEAPVSGDVEDWNNGSMPERHRDLASQFLRFFVQSDVNVGAGYRILRRVVANNQINMVYDGASNREATHQINYANVIDTLNLPESEYQAFLNVQEMMEKHEFMLDLKTDTVEEFALSLVRMICSEGITLYGSFITLLSFANRGLMRGMGTVIEWSIRDEEMHCEGHTNVWHDLLRDYPEIFTDALKQRVYLTVEKCVWLEERFIDVNFDICGDDLPNLTREQMKLHIRYLANRRLMALGLKPIFTDVDPNVAPVPWLAEQIQGERHSNFFENRSTEYSAGGMPGLPTYGRQTPAKIAIYWREKCEFCDKAKSLAKSLSIPMTLVDLTDYDLRQDFFNEHGFDGNERRVPKIYEVYQDGRTRLIGGYTEFAEEARTYYAQRLVAKSVIFAEPDVSEDDIVI